MKEIKQESDILREKADALEYFASTLTYEHQKSARIELEAKARNLRELLRENKTKL